MKKSITIRPLIVLLICLLVVSSTACSSTTANEAAIDKQLEGIVESLLEVAQDSTAEEETADTEEKESDSSGSQESADEIICFILSDVDEDVLVDTNGNEIMRAENLSFPFLDKIGKKSFVASSRKGEYNEVMQKDDWVRSLYSLDGALLLDSMTNRVFISAFGDYVVISNYVTESSDTMDGEEPFSNLINAYTGEILFEDIHQIFQLDENRFVLININMCVVYVTDIEGNILHTFPEERCYRGIEKYGNSYAVQKNNSPEESIFDADWIFLNERFEPLELEGSPYQSLFITDDYTDFPYLMANPHSDSDSDMRYVIDTLKGEVVYSAQGLREYYENCYIINTVKSNSFYTKDGTLFADLKHDYRSLPATESRGRLFYYRHPENRDIVCMDETGTVLAQKHLMDDLPSIQRCGDFIKVEHESLGAFLVDENLNVRNPGGKTYKSFNHAKHYGNFYTALYKDENGETIFDILSADGIILAEGVAPFYSNNWDHRQGYVGVNTAEYSGIVDSNGNWVYRIDKAVG